MQYEYQVTWSGQENQTLSLGGIAFENGKTKYFTDDNLPMQINDLRRIPGVTVTKGIFLNPGEKAPGDINSSEVFNRAQNIGLVWKGSSRIKVVTINDRRITLQAHVPNFELSESEVNEVSSKYSYVEKVNRPL